MDKGEQSWTFLLANALVSAVLAGSVGVAVTIAIERLVLYSLFSAKYQPDRLRTSGRNVGGGARVRLPVFVVLWDKDNPLNTQHTAFHNRAGQCWVGGASQGRPRQL